MIGVDEIRTNVSLIEKSYDSEPIRSKFGFTVTHTDLLGKLNYSAILSEEQAFKLVELNKTEQCATQSPSTAWTEFLKAKESEKIHFQDNPDFTQTCVDRFSCSICRIALPDFEHYQLHFFGNLHTQRKRRVAMRANRLDMCSWDKLVQLLCECNVKLSDVIFENWTMPDNQYKVRMRLDKYKFQVVGTDFKSMRLKVVDKALDFAEANFCVKSGCRIVRFPYLPEIERAPVVIDNIKSTYLYSLPKPLNDDTNLPIDIVVMSLIDYIACHVAAEEKRRYGKHLMDVFRKAHLSKKAAFCDICDTRLPEGLCASSLVLGTPIEEVENYESISQSFKELVKAYRAPFELLDLLKRYCYYYCAFCKFPIRHDTELEKHIRTANHMKNMTAKEVASEENFKNRDFMKEHIRQLLIPAEYKNETTSIDQLPESVRNELPLDEYTDEILDKSIDAAISDPDALIERATKRFMTGPTGDNKSGGRRRKRGFPGGRNRGDGKRSRRRRGNFLGAASAAKQPKFNAPLARGDLSSRGQSDSRARMAALSGNDNKVSRDTRRLTAAEELRRRRGLAYSGSQVNRMNIRRPLSPMLQSLSADHRLFGRTNVIDRLRDRVASYDENQRNNFSRGFVGQWSAGSMDHRDNRQWSRPIARNDYPVQSPMMPPNIDHMAFSQTNLSFPAGMPGMTGMYPNQYNTGLNGPASRYYRN